MNAFRLTLIGLALGLLLVGLPLGSVLSVPGWQQPARAESPNSPTDVDSIRLTIPPTEAQFVTRNELSQSEIAVREQRLSAPSGSEPDAHMKLEINFRELESRFDAVLATRVVPVSHDVTSGGGLQYVKHATWRDAPDRRKSEVDKRPIAPTPDGATMTEEPAAAPTVDDSYSSDSSFSSVSFQDGGCGGSGCGGDVCGACDPCEPWRLFKNGICGWEIGGHISAGGYSNEHGNASNSPALSFNEIGNEFTLNQLWIYAEKAVDTGGCGWDIGGRVDFVFGVDGPENQGAFGDSWDTEWNTSASYGSAMPQLYGEIGYNDWAVKVGHFHTIIGWEVASAPDNFFYSHSYAFFFGEPLTHTGALASYSGYQDWTFYGGWTYGWNTGFEDTSISGASTFLGGASWDVNDCMTLTYAISAGEYGQGQDSVFMNSLVAEVSLSDRLTWIIQHDLGNVETAGGGEIGGVGINQYLQYEISDCLAAGMRFEWFQDTDGLLVRDSANNLTQGDFFALTAGMNYKPTANIIFRPELRYDWFDGVAEPFDSGTQGDQFGGGFDCIFLY